MSRSDLNRWHLLARGGIIEHRLDLEHIDSKNKNDWLPVHLAKNSATANWLTELTLTKNIALDDIVMPALINNAQSIQTKYGQDLYDFFIEQGFSSSQATSAATTPSTQSRIELSYYWLSLVNFEPFLYYNKNNPIEVALSYSNSYFFMALKELMNKKPELESIIKLLINACSYTIGDIYLKKDRAFQLKQVLKQHFDIDKKINHITVNGINNNNGSAINKLEGF